MTVPSIKGTAFVSAHADVHALLGRGALTRDALEVALEAQDLGILDEKVQPAAWYPIATYDRLLRVLCEHEAGGSVEGYLVARGEKAGERLAASGIYQQLGATTGALRAHTGRIVLTVAGLIYNFTSWRFAGERGNVRRFSLEVDEAAAFPESARLTTQGFIQYAATRIIGQPMRATSERPLASRILFHVAAV